MCSPLTLLSVKLPTYPQMYRLEGSYFYIVIKLLMFVYRSPNRRPPEVVEWREYQQRQDQFGRGEGGGVT